MALVTHLLPLPLATVRVVDAVGLALLLLFALWGLRRGALRQGLSLAVVLGGLLAATWLGPRAEPTVAKVSALTGEARAAAAWGGVLFAALVLGGVLLSYLCCRLPPRADGRADRLVGALFGGVKGLLVLVVAAYVLVTVDPGAGPALTRPTGAVRAEAPEAPWVGRLRGSLSASAMAWVADGFDRVLPLPGWMVRRRAAVDEALRADAVPGRRPRGG